MLWDMVKSLITPLTQRLVSWIGEQVNGWRMKRQTGSCLPDYLWETLGWYAYPQAEVVWHVERQNITGLKLTTTNPREIRVNWLPRCWRCGCELRQKRGGYGLIWWRFIWWCRQGHVEIRSDHHFQAVKQDVQQVVQARLEGDPRWTPPGPPWRR
jgi:hypothetical protein